MHANKGRARTLKKVAKGRDLRRMQLGLHLDLDIVAPSPVGKLFLLFKSLVSSLCYSVSRTAICYFFFFFT